MRRKIPVVGSKQLHPVQLAPQIRGLEARRTRGAAQREYAPVLAADRREFGATKGEYRNEARSARGATNAVESALSQALRGLRGSGLKGGYLRQTQHEFTSREADTASALPSLLAGAAEERNKGLREDRSNLIQDRAAESKTAAEAFNERLKELRGLGSTAEKEEHKAPSREQTEDLKNAAIAFQNALTNWQKNPVVEVNGKKMRVQKYLPLKTKDEWRQFGEEVEHHADGFNLTDVMTVINHYLKKSARGAHQFTRKIDLVDPWG